MWPVGESKTSGGRRTDLALQHSLCDLGEAVSLSGPHGSTSEQARGKITGAGAAAASDAPRDCFQLSGPSPSNVPESPSSEDLRPAPPRCRWWGRATGLGNQAHTGLATGLLQLLSSFHASRASVSLQLCVWFFCVCPFCSGPAQGREASDWAPGVYES